MNRSFELGEDVVARFSLRNDGTYPDPKLPVGSVLVEKGSRGTVSSVGSFLIDRVVYAVSFENGRLVGCLSHELEPDEVSLNGKES